MNETLSVKKSSGKSCLVCRRRKVKCDKTRPVCLSCVKHSSEIQCAYDGAGNGVKGRTPFRFQNVIYKKSVASSPEPRNNNLVKQSSRNSIGCALSTTTQLPNLRKDRISEEMESLRNNLFSLERLLASQADEVSETSDSNVSNNCNDSISMALRNLPPMSFYDYDMIEVKAGRLSFDGPLCFRSVSKKDPFLVMITTMIRMERNSTYEKATRRRNHRFRKYPDIQYTPSEIMKQLMINKRASMARLRGSSSTKSKISGRSADLSMKISTGRQKASKNEFETGNDTTSPKAYTPTVTDTDQNDDEIDTEEDEDEDEDSAEKDQVDRRFKERLIENESLDQINKILQRNKKDVTKPLSVSNILNETEDGDSTEQRDSDRGGSDGKNSSEVGNIETWKKLKTILDDLETLRQSRLQVPASNQRVHEILFGMSAYQPNPEVEILVRIQAMLPPEKVIWLHLDNYFRSPIHGMFPVLNEDWFRDTLISIIGKNKSREVQPILTLTRRFDFANIGILMTILMLSSLIYRGVTANNATEEEKYILSFPIGKEFMDAAQMCMNLFKLLRKPALPVVHCGLMIRLYRRFALEEGDVVDPADTSSLTGLLIQMAYGLGVNTDAETCHQLRTYEMYLQQWRKIWYLLYFLDLDEALDMGNTVLIDENSFNTKLPSIPLDEHGEFASFVTNPSLEIATVECMNTNFGMALTLRKALRHVTNKTCKTSCENIQTVLDLLESESREKYGNTLEDIIMQPIDNLESSVMKLNAFRGFVQSKKVLLSIYISMFIHIDKKVGENPELYDGTLPLHYMRKLLSIYVEIEPILTLALLGHDYTSDAVERVFGRGSEVIVLQICMEFIAKFPPVLHLLISRSLHLKFNYVNDTFAHEKFTHSGDVKVMCRLIDSIVNTSLDKLSHLNAVISKISHINFQAWKISRGSLFTYSILKNQENCLFDYSSRLNRFHRDLQGIINQTGESQIKPQFNPINYFPKYNTFTQASVTDLQEIISILSYTKWHIFLHFIDEDECRMASGLRMDHRGNGKSSTSKRRPSKAGRMETNIGSQTPHSAYKHFGASMQIDQSNVSKSQSPRSTTSTGENDYTSSQGCDTAGWTEHNCDEVEEMDEIWYENILRNNNIDKDIFANYNKMASTNQSEAIGQPPLRRPSQSNAFVRPEASEVTTTPVYGLGTDALGLDEIFNNQFLLQEHVIKQLQQITNDQLSIHNSNRSQTDHSEKELDGLNPQS